MFEKKVTRRGFVEAAAASAAGAVILQGGVALADEAPEGNSAVDPIPPVGVPEVWDYETDVVVVGSGGGGLNAAARLAEQGVQVILIEKTGVIGGNSASAGGSITMGGDRYSNANEAALPEYPFDRVKWLEWKQEHRDYSLDPHLQLLICDNMGPAHDWMGDCGVNWFAVGTTLVPMERTPGTHNSQHFVTDAMYEYGKGLGVQYLLDTPAQALVVDDSGRVVGIKATDEKDAEVWLHASKAVVLCAGGFAANKDMLATYCPNALINCNNCYVAPCDSGECIRMGLGLGATLINTDSYAMFDGGIPYERYGGEWCTFLYNGSTQLVRQPWLTIDTTGARKPYVTTQDAITMSGGGLTRQANAQTATPNHRSYVFFDNTYDNSLTNVFRESFCRKPICDAEPPADGFLPEHYLDWRNGANDAIESGVIASADTLEELAEKLGLDPEVVTKAVADWNAVCEKGEDDEVLAYQPEWLIPIVEPPFYGAEVGGILFRTNTGLAINTKMQVLDGTGLPIPGLYAGWYTAGGSCIDGGASDIKYEGEGVSLTYTGGYIIGNSIVENEA